MNDIEKRLAAIESRFAISELRSKYCWYTTRGMREELLSLFTSDGVFENSRSEGEAPNIVKGQEALNDYFSRMRPARRIPLVVNEVITVNGDEAEGTCAMLGAGNEPFCGHYIDTFTRIDGQWKFRVRRFFPYWPIYKPSTDRQHP